MTNRGLTAGDGAADGEGGVAGLSGAALVTRRGSMVLEAAGGTADAATGAPCTPQTRFPVSSVSKQFTAAAVMLLVEARLLTLDDTLGRLLPNCPEHWRAISVHHLLTHTSGLGHWSSVPEFDVLHPVPAEEFLHLAARTPLLSRPGRRWSYSGTGYLLAAGLVEHAAGQQYAEFLAERIFAPLGLARTTAGRYLGGPGSSVNDVARDGHNAGRPTATAPGLAGYPGTGDVWSTVGDLARYALAVNSGALLSERSRQLVHHPHAKVPKVRRAREQVLSFDGYGYGYYLGTVAGTKGYCHSGDTPGFQSFHAWLPDQDVCIAVLTNDEASDLGRIVGRLLAV